MVTRVPLADANQGSPRRDSVTETPRVYFGPSTVTKIFSD